MNDGNYRPRVQRIRNQIETSVGFPIMAVDFLRRIEQSVASGQSFANRQRFPIETELHANWSARQQSGFCSDAAPHRVLWSARISLSRHGNHTYSLLSLCEMPEQNFQVNLGGVIRLLSDHLYSGPEVFARELLQNAVDAITARQHREESYRGTIRIEVVGNDEARTITVVDDGIGLTESEVHQFLATIGESSKSSSVNREDFIGQFGIGLLSGFVVSDEITVITKSIQPDSFSGRVERTGRRHLLGQNAH